MKNQNGAACVVLFGRAKPEAANDPMPLAAWYHVKLYRQFGILLLSRNASRVAVKGAGNLKGRLRIIFKAGHEMKPFRKDNPIDLVELFRHQVDLQTVAAGQVLFKEGERGNFMYVLMSGTAEIIVRNRVMETAVAGTIVGEMAIIDDNVRSATVVAKSDCKFLPIERERFNFLVQRKPEFALHVMRVMVDRLRRTDAVL